MKQRFCIYKLIALAFLNHTKRELRVIEEGVPRRPVIIADDRRRGSDYGAIATGEAGNE